MHLELENPFDEPDLLGAPVMRAAYSDRTAWLMSVMSELAYRRFEDDDTVLELATELSTLTDIEVIKEQLKKILSGTTNTGNKEKLRALLDFAGFTLLKTYNRGDTQAFLAKRSIDGSPPHAGACV